MRPAVLAGIVGIALAVMVAVDVWGARSAQRSATQILEDATEGIRLVEDMRLQVERLSRGDDVTHSAAQLASDMSVYAPLATFEDEGSTWTKVRDELVIALDAARRGDLSVFTSRSDAISSALEKLVGISSRETVSLTKDMVGDRRTEIVGDVIAVLAAAAMIAILAIRLSRTQDRERRLIAENLERAEERNRELDAFAGRAAHDLRSPLNPIRGYAELISTDASVPPDTRRQASLVIKAVMRMTRIIDDMLALARAGHPEAGTASMTRAISMIRDELSAELADANVEVTNDSAVVACSESSLEQILRNLIGNAAKYRSPERPLQIAITCTHTADHATIVVADNGVGMDAEAREHAFDPFYRGRRDIAGTGLGLSIVERLTRAHRGTCEIDAGHTPGTRVIITLPVAPTGSLA